MSDHPDTFIGKGIVGEDVVCGVIGTSGAIIFRTFGRDDDDENQVLSVRPEHLEQLLHFVGRAIFARENDKAAKGEMR